MAAQTVRFRLLGPVDVWYGGTTLELRGAQPRCVLAMLLLGDGQAVSVDRLVDALWGDRPPRDPKSLLQVHVYRLRKLLSAVPGVGLHTVGRHGYRLEVPAGSVDVFRFRELVRRAQGCGDPREAVDLLERALALWHGEPLGGVAGDLHAQGVAAALEEERLLAVEARIAALLRLGRHEDVVPELSMRLADHPTRESLAAALMEALHGAGRTDEALGVFRDLRARMVDELGVEPSARVQELHRSILDVSGTAPAAEASPLVVPAQLPADLARFVGRYESVVRLRAGAEAPAGTPRVLAVTGPPGAGKTVLAVHVGHLVRERFPDGQLYAHLAGARAPADAGDVLGAFLAALGVPAGSVPPDTEQRAALFRSILAGRRVLVVLDDARDAAQVRPLLPSDAGSAVLVTSRSTLASLDADVRVEVGTLGREDAVALLATELDDDRLHADPVALDEVVHACGGLPLALRIVARRLATRPRWTVRALADRLRDERERLGELSVGDLSVGAGIRLTYHQLDPDSARAFRLLGLVEGHDIGVHEAAALLGEPYRRAGRLLDGLREVHLVEADDGERFRVHDLLRVFARTEGESVDPAGERVAAVTRLACCYAEGLRNASLTRTPGLVLEEFGLPAADVEAATFDSAERATGWLERECGNIAAAVRVACAHDTLPAQAVSRLAGAFSRFADPRGYLGDLDVVIDAAIARARAEPDPVAEGIALVSLGVSRIHQYGKRAGVEVTREAVRLLRGSGTRSEASALNNLALGTDDLAECLVCLRRAVGVYESLGDERGATTALGNVADHHLRAGEYADAVAVGREALDRALRIEAADLATNTRTTIAEALHGLGEHDEALALVRTAVADAATLGHGTIAAQADLAYARMLRDAEDLAESVDRYERTLAAFRVLGAQHEVATTTAELGDVLERIGQSGRADACRSAAGCFPRRV